MAKNSKSGTFFGKKYKKWDNFSRNTVKGTFLGNVLKYRIFLLEKMVHFGKIMGHFCGVRSSAEWCGVVRSGAQ